MKLYTILMLSAILAPSLYGGSPPVENAYVKALVSLTDTAITQGGTGRIVIAFTPVDGIHINVDPPVVVKLERKAPLKLKGKPAMSTDKESGYLSTSEPVKQRFAVTRNAKPGNHAIRGTLVYYFCSDTEGWCRKFTQPIALKLNVTKK